MDKSTCEQLFDVLESLSGKEIDIVFVYNQLHVLFDSDVFPVDISSDKITSTILIETSKSTKKGKVYYNLDTGKIISKNKANDAKYVFFSYECESLEYNFAGRKDSDKVVYLTKLFEKHGTRTDETKSLPPKKILPRRT